MSIVIYIHPLIGLLQQSTLLPSLPLEGKVDFAKQKTDEVFQIYLLSAQSRYSPVAAYEPGRDLLLQSSEVAKQRHSYVPTTAKYLRILRKQSKTFSLFAIDSAWKKQNANHRPPLITPVLFFIPPSNLGFFSRLAT